MDPTTANHARETDQLNNSNAVGANKGKKEKQTWGQFFYNPKNGKVMNRSIGSWFQLLLFYIVFYALLAAFWAVMLAVFLQTLDDKYPKWSGPQSVMSTDHGSGWGPGVSFQPQPSSDSTLISLDRTAPSRSKRDTKQGDSGSAPPNVAQAYVDKMRDFLKKYRQPNPNRQDCKTRMLDDTTACAFDVNTFGSECSEADGFGYYKNEPCVVVAVNRIFGWTPQPYNNAVKGQEIPMELQNYLNRLNGRPQYNPKRVYFVCDGEDPVDQEHIGEVRMIPPDGIDVEKFFPYQHQKGYVSPLVAARFTNVTRDLVVNVVCRAFAGNIPFSSDDRLGATKFEILIRGDNTPQARS